MKVKQVKELATAFGVAIAACALAVASTRYLTFIGGFENIANDIRIAALQPPMPQSSNIAVAGIISCAC